MSDIARQPPTDGRNTGTYSSPADADSLRQVVFELIGEHSGSLRSVSGTLQLTDNLVELGLSSIELLNVFAALDMLAGFDISKISLDELPRSIADLLVLAEKMREE